MGSDIDFWAVNPGGRRIIEEAQNGLGLTEEQCKYSWEVLDQYGNMLSPSVMFVLELILKEHNEKLSKGEEGFSQGLAFSFPPASALRASFSRCSSKRSAQAKVQFAVHPLIFHHHVLATIFAHQLSRFHRNKDASLALLSWLLF